MLDGLLFWSWFILIKRCRCFCTPSTAIQNFSSLFFFFLYIFREWNICCHVVYHDSVLHISNWRVSESNTSSDLLTLLKRLERHCSSSCSLCQSAIWVNVSYLPYIQQCLFRSSFCMSTPTVLLVWYHIEFPVLYIKLNLKPPETMRDNVSHICFSALISVWMNVDCSCI